MVVQMHWFKGCSGPNTVFNSSTTHTTVTNANSAVNNAPGCAYGRAAVGYREAVEGAEAYPTHTGAAGTVTPILAPALALLQVREVWE